MSTGNDTETGYAAVNGLNLYYETHGTGEPLILLPGGFMTVAALGDIVPQLAASHRVIGVELQGHGHTADIDRPLRFEDMAEDVAELIQQLGLRSAHVFGYSLGGGVGLQLAIRHPELVRKLVLASTAFKRDGWYPEALAGMAAISEEAFLQGPLHTSYLQTSPRPEAWPTFVGKMRALLTTDYDWTADVAHLQPPTLILVGDADGLRLAHAVELFGLLGGGKGDGDLSGLPPSQLAVLPATTHVGWAPPYHGIMNRTRLLLPILNEFLDAP
jgi:pimeloyl-ACP methyl ester carboxylesterase